MNVSSTKNHVLSVREKKFGVYSIFTLLQLNHANCLCTFASSDVHNKSRSQLVQRSYCRFFPILCLIMKTNQLSFRLVKTIVFFARSLQFFSVWTKEMMTSWFLLRANDSSVNVTWPWTSSLNQTTLPGYHSAWAWSTQQLDEYVFLNDLQILALSVSAHSLIRSNLQVSRLQHPL